MAKLVLKCPCCEGDLKVTKMTCSSCQTQLDGQFDIPPLLQLPPADLAFITAFVRASGSLKTMAQLEGVSYPTVRNRMDDIIERLNSLEQSLEKKRHDILDALESGKMSAKQAVYELKKVGL